jgi:membrane fusion protein, copper/silver efflux system
MNRKTMVVITGALVVLAAAGYGLYSAGMNSGMQMAGGSASAAPGAIAGAERRPLYWHDPMVPGTKFDKPGKSPFMDMQLVPVYADEAGGEGAVRIDSRVQQNLGIRTAEVMAGSVAPTLEAVGNVAYNERDVAVVQARSNGYLERLYVRAPLDAVKQGQALAELYVPDWVAAQEEYLAVRRMGEGAPAGLLDAARQRMRLAGMSDEQAALVERDGKSHARLTISAPISGVVAELSAREGMTVMSGAPLFRINGLGTVWINAEVSEGAAHAVRPGTRAEARTAAYPAEVFEGRVTAILPEVNAATRTLKARVEVANPKGELVPGMFARVTFAPTARRDALVVPSEAVIRTGTRSVVMVARAEGKFTPVEVELGEEGGGRTEVRGGLQAGDKVVVSGQFLVDSEASLRGVEMRMQPDAPAAGVATGAQTHKGEGRVERIGKDEITLSHGPIPSLQWPPMTMGFKLPAAGLPADIKAGDQVTFETRQMPDGQFAITAITRSGGAAK